ncbi:MAG: hypothetical protein ACK5TQ_07425, partial [Acetobacteraceae bacterium]
INRGRKPPIKMMSFFDDGSHPHKMAIYSIKSRHQKIIGATQRKQPSNSRIGRAGHGLRLMSTTRFLDGVIEPCFQRWYGDGDFSVDKNHDGTAGRPDVVKYKVSVFKRTFVLTNIFIGIPSTQ